LTRVGPRRTSESGSRSRSTANRSRFAACDSAGLRFEDETDCWPRGVALEFDAESRAPSRRRLDDIIRRAVLRSGQTFDGLAIDDRLAGGKPRESRTARLLNLMATVRTLPDICRDIKNR
jgi:hypothetical protein